MGFPGGTVVKNLPANCKNSGSIPGSRRSPVVGNSNLIQYSCLENLYGQRSNWAYTHKPNNNSWPHASPIFKWFQSVKSLSHVQLFATPWTAAPRLPCLSPTPGAYSNSCPLYWWCHPTVSSLVIPFSSCLQSFPASRSFPVNQFFASDGQSIGVSASASVLPINTEDWFPLGWTGWISLQSKGLKSLLQHHSSRASILRCSAFFIVQLSHPYMTIGKTIALTRWTLLAK